MKRDYIRSRPRPRGRAVVQRWYVPPHLRERKHGQRGVPAHKLYFDCTRAGCVAYQSKGETGRIHTWGEGTLQHLTSIHDVGKREGKERRVTMWGEREQRKKKKKEKKGGLKKDENPLGRRRYRKSIQAQYQKPQSIVGVVMESESLEWKVGGKGRGVFVDMTRHAPEPGGVERIKDSFGAQRWSFRDGHNERD